MSRQQDEQTERNWFEIQSELNPGETAIERTLSNIAIVKAGWNRIRTEKGAWAYFPDVPTHPSGSAAARAAEDEWQDRSLAMHKNQVPLNILEKQIEESTGKGGSFRFHRVVADESPQPIPKYHESVASAERQRQTTRGN